MMGPRQGIAGEFRSIGHRVLLKDPVALKASVVSGCHGWGICNPRSGDGVERVPATVGE